MQHKSNFTETYRRSFYGGPNFNTLQETVSVFICCYQFEQAPVYLIVERRSIVQVLFLSYSMNVNILRGNNQKTIFHGSETRYTEQIGPWHPKYPKNMKKAIFWLIFHFFGIFDQSKRSILIELIIQHLAACICSALFLRGTLLNN